MSPSLQSELKQRKPFTSPEHEAVVSLARTAAILEHQLAEALKPHGLTPTQYNALRILRGAEPNGLCRNEVRDRLVTRMPDVTRLLDRMEEAGLVARVRSTTDRRLVNTRLTPRGREVVDSLDDPVAEEHRRRLGHLSDEQLQTLIALLSVARGAA